MKSSILMVSISAYLFLLSSVFGDDVAGLRTVCEQLFAARHGGDAGAFVDLYHEEYARFLRNRIERRTKQERLEYWKQVLPNHEYWEYELIEPQYSVVGDTGIVLAILKVSEKHKNAPPEATTRRYTATWVNCDGKWFLLSSHTFALSLGN